MDSYLVQLPEEKNPWLLFSQLQTPLELSNPALPVLAYEITDGELVPVGFDFGARGVHIRNIVAAVDPTELCLYFVDHGVDLAPFPGGEVFRYSHVERRAEVLAEFSGRYNFSAAGHRFQHKRYEVFIGMNYAVLYIDGVRSAEFDELIAQNAEIQGYLTAQFFVHHGCLNLFLGISDAPGHFEIPVERFDLRVVFAATGPRLERVSRGVAWDWGTVYSDLSVLNGKPIIKVAFHDNGFNRACIGYYEIGDALTYVPLATEPQLGLCDQWVPQFHLVPAKAGTAQRIFALVRPGSRQGKNCVLELTLGATPERKVIDEAFIGLHAHGSSLLAVRHDLRLITLHTGEACDEVL